MSYPRFKFGDRVILPRNDAEGWDQEMATVIGQCPDGLLMVEVFPRNKRTDPDGLRELFPEGVVLYEQAN